MGGLIDPPEAKSTHFWSFFRLNWFKNDPQKGVKSHPKVTFRAKSDFGPEGGVGTPQILVGIPI